MRRSESHLHALVHPLTEHSLLIAARNSIIFHLKLYADCSIAILIIGTRVAHVRLPYKFNCIRPVCVCPIHNRSTQFPSRHVQLSQLHRNERSETVKCVCVFVVEAWVWRHRWPTVKIVGTPASDFGPPRDKIITDLIGANRTKFYFALPPMAFGDICNIDSNWIFYGWPHALAHSDDPTNTIHIITIIIMHRVEKMCDDKLIFYSCCDWLEAIGINAVCCVHASIRALLVSAQWNSPDETFLLKFRIGLAESDSHVIFHPTNFNGISWFCWLRPERRTISRPLRTQLQMRRCVICLLLFIPYQRKVIPLPCINYRVATIVIKHN